MTEEKPIDYRFKILYAIGIVMVVCGHTDGGGVSIMNDWFPYGSLHLALFAFCSGYFYKSVSEENAGQYILKKIKTLLIPLYIYTLIYGIIVQLLRVKGFEMGGDLSLFNLLIAPITDGHQFVYNMGGWFVVPLFMVETYNILIRKFLKAFNKSIPEVVFLFIDVGLGIMGNQLACLGYLDGWWLVLVRMLFFVPFYELGIFYRKHLEQYARRIPSFWYFTVIFTIKLIILYIYGKMPSYTPSWCNDFSEGPIIPIFIETLGIAFWMRIATLVEPVIGKSKWINLIADNTYSIMINQFWGFMIVKTFFALLSKVSPAFSNFDWVSYKTNIWWYYVPKGLNNMLILYVIGGITFPIAVQKIIDRMKKTLIGISN